MNKINKINVYKNILNTSKCQFCKHNNIEYYIQCYDSTFDLSSELSTYLDPYSDNIIEEFGICTRCIQKIQIDNSIYMYNNRIYLYQTFYGI
jgi:hypothetical protein